MIEYIGENGKVFPRLWYSGNKRKQREHDKSDSSSNNNKQTTIKIFIVKKLGAFDLASPSTCYVLDSVELYVSLAKSFELKFQIVSDMCKCV